MKKTLLLAVSLLIIVQGGLCLASTETTSILSDIKDAIVSDVSSTVTSGVNSIKLAAYKTELAQKQQELEELDSSSTNVVIKFFKKIKINKKISELESNISELESSTEN